MEQKVRQVLLLDAAITRMGRNEVARILDVLPAVLDDWAAGWSRMPESKFALIVKLLLSRRSAGAAAKL